MAKEESIKKLCVVLYNGIKAKLNAVYEANIDIFYLPNGTLCELLGGGITIYNTNPYGKTKVTENGVENDAGKVMLMSAAIALLFLTEAFAQGHKYKIDLERGIIIFGEFSPAIVFDEEQEDGVINYYIQMIHLLANGVSESEK